MSDFISNTNGKINSMFAAKKNILSNAKARTELQFRDLKEDTFTKSINSERNLRTGFFDEIAGYCAVSSRCVQKYYDEIYGAGNWEYVSIGRSCALISKCLNELGAKAHIIPISGLTDGIAHGSEIVQKDGFDEFRTYIYGLGLNPQNISKSKKVYIFQDYVSSGKTLKRFEEFIRTPEMGLDKENVIFEGINMILEKNIKAGKHADEIFQYKRGIDSQSTFFSYKNYARIKNLYVNNLKDITRGIIDSASPTYQEFDDALMASLKRIKSMM